MEPRVVIVGAGIAGLSSALVLAARGVPCAVYDGTSEVRQRTEESWPIVINPRGMRALGAIDLRVHGALCRQPSVCSIDIHQNGKRITRRTKPGPCVGATRGFVVSALYQAADRHVAQGLIQIHLGHRLERFDVDQGVLGFQTPEGEHQVTLEGRLLLAADGVWSKTRRLLQQARPDALDARVEDWGMGFRVLLGPVGAELPGLDVTRHYVFNNLYVAHLGDRWALSVGNNPADTVGMDWLTSEEATPANLRALRDLLRRHSPETETLWSDEELETFFSRPMFGGAVVTMDRIAALDQILFLGDAGHAVCPPVGEGLNGALEDAQVLGRIFDEQRSVEAVRFSRAYQHARYGDIQALGEYARTMMRAWMTTPVARREHVLISIMLALAKRLRLVKATWENHAAGLHEGAEVPSYREMHRIWSGQMRRVQPIAQRLVRLFAP